MSRKTPGATVVVSPESARAAAELLTSGLTGEDQRLACDCLVAGLSAAYRRTASGPPGWLLDLTRHEAARPALASIIADLRQAAMETSWDVRFA